MAKKSFKPTTTLLPFPTPVVMATCKGRGGTVNIITLAWVGVVNSEPPMIGIAVRPSRFSHKMIEESGEFVVNVPSENLLKKVDFCGVASGEKVDKFEATGLTPSSAQKVDAPLIQECPVNLECVVRQILRFDSHDFFVGEVVTVNAEEAVLGQGESIDIQKALPFVYCPGARRYWNLGKAIGTYGFTKGQL